MKTSKNIFIGVVFGVLLVIIAFLSFKANKEPRVVTTTKTIKVPVKGIISDVKISNQPIPTQVIIKENKAIVYVKKDSAVAVGDSVQTANQYSARVEANDATADLSILTTGRLLDVQGVINYQKEITTVETVKYRNNSTGYLYYETSVAPKLQMHKVGIDYTIKDKFIIGSSIGYDNVNSEAYAFAKIGFRIF